MTSSALHRRSTRPRWKQPIEHPHPRLEIMARMIRGLPGKRVLDVGCAGGMLGMMLGPGYDYYGCDRADHADRRLLPGRFLQIDLNASSDLSYFRGRGIDLAHLGMVECLEQPAEVLQSLRELLGSGSHLAVSLVNFRGDRLPRPGPRQPAFVHRPSLVELRSTLARSGWTTIKTVPILGEGVLRELAFAGARLALGADHPWIAGMTRHYLLAARAV